MKTKLLATAFSVFAMGASAENIVEIAAGNEDFSTLVAAVGAADLAETLSGEGPFTVFAPTNEAFAALPEGTVEELLKPENKEKLQGVLLYHVYALKAMSTDLNEGKTKLTAPDSDTTLCVIKDMDGVMLDDGSGEMAKVFSADIEADNGVIHVIDRVIMPGQEVDC